MEKTKNQNLDQNLDQNGNPKCPSKQEFFKEGVSRQLWENLNTDKYPKLILSQPDENSPKIRTCSKNNSYFADKGTSLIDKSQSYSIQDLVLVNTYSYCSPDWRSYGHSILDIDLFPKESDLPDEYDNTTSNKYWSGRYDYLAYNKENKNIFTYTEDSPSFSKTHYFWISADDRVLLPDIEKVEPCNGWYFHHIIIDDNSDYKYVDEDNIQEVVNALIDQKREKERIAEYRKKNWDIGIERPFWDDKILVKYWKPGESTNFYRDWEWYTLDIDENRYISIFDWWHRESKDSTIQKWQIFVNGQDVYESTIARITEYPKEQKEKRNTKFNELKEYFINEAGFSEDEFKDLTKYPRKWERLSFLEWIRWLLSKKDYDSDVLSIKNENITKDEIFTAVRETVHSRMNYAELVIYILIKRKADNINYYVAKNAVDNAYAIKYCPRKLIIW